MPSSSAQDLTSNKPASSTLTDKFPLLNRIRLNARVVRKAHRWLSVIVAVQLFCWMISGLYMTLVPIELVRGEDQLKPASVHSINGAQLNNLPEIISRYPDLLAFKVFNRADGVALIQVNTPAGRQLIDAESAEIAKQLSSEQAASIAQRRYAGDSDVSEVKLIETSEAAPEARGRKLPLWQVSFDDTLQTKLYLDSKTGQVMAVRNQLWRWFDFLWMLHIMDYQERENFNNPLVILMASLGLLFTLSGILMLINGWRKQGGNFLR